ncbi:MAG TPA: cation:proton antiporter [Candidatus Nanoarchaeia archaeon]|nr:cation:proton antiporter [Candidatus Nanoarchaeia archaeon]
MAAVNGDIFLYLGVIVAAAAIAAYLLKLINQPPILAYVLAGIFLPSLFKLVTGGSMDYGIVESISIIGIAFLLFIVGVEIDLKKLKTVALVSNIGGGISIILLFVFGYLVALLLGFLSLEAAYLGLMMAFSSTMVVLKLLSDKRELNTLHGRIVVGMLLLQDIVAIFALSVLGSIDHFSAGLLGFAIVKFLALFAVAIICSKFVFPLVFRFAAKNQELLLISSLAVCFIFSLAFQYLGFSIAIGAFVAGLTLGNLEYNVEIVGRVKSLRDFFSLIFFVSLGMGLSLGMVKSIIWPLIIFTLFVIVLKPVLIMLICSLFQYTKKPSFLSSMALANIGEFSLIIASHGYYELGHISQESFSLIVIVTLASITLTSYLLKFDFWFYKLFEKPLRIFDRFTTKGLEYTPTEIKPKIILCGHDRIGFSILQTLKQFKNKVLVIDYNPEIISKLAKEKYHCIYGEVTDEEILERMNLKHIDMLISTVPEFNDNLFLVKKVKATNNRAKIIVTASRVEEALELYKSGADYVILPHFLGGEHVANIITGFREKKIKLDETRADHIQHLEERKGLGHKHPKAE